MKKINKLLLLSLLLCFSVQQHANAQATPEILYYKFDEVGTTVTNHASTPPPGTATATILGSVTQGGTGQCAPGALIGSGLSAGSDYLNTNWITDLGAGSWTISFWSSGFGSTTFLYYIFGDVNAGAFRCFTNGVAGANNWILRGGGLTDVYLNGGATAAPTLNTFVYDQVAGQVRGYINGVLVTTVSQGALAINGTGPFKVMGYGTNIGAPVGALLDEFRVYNRPLDVSEILQLASGASTSTDVQTACGSYTWIDGNTYTANNNTAQYTLVGGAASGCDSLITLNLTINLPSSSTDIQTACGSYTWIDGNTYTSNNNTATYTYIGGVANGCDSTVTLDLTINPLASSTDVQTACESFTWIDGNSYTANNNTATYTYLGGAVNGCDSIVTLDLTINQPSSSTDVQTACDSYTWIDGNTYTASNNTATFTISGGAANGCDSIVTLNLTINAVSSNATTVSGITITATNNNATYAWLDCNNGFAPIAGQTAQTFTPTINGNYAVQLTENGCVDTSTCVQINSVGISQNTALNDVSIYTNTTTGNFTI
ncbi:MAG: LamG-like jellyroll fold domain-containing protein [Fluviicola sp.]